MEKAQLKSKLKVMMMHDYYGKNIKQDLNNLTSLSPSLSLGISAIMHRFILVLFVFVHVLALKLFTYTTKKGCVFCTLKRDDRLYTIF